MAVFTDAELEYLAGQHLGRLATLGPDGAPQVRPVGFRVDPASGVIEITGMNMTTSQKFRNVRADGRVSFVVDDLASVQPWRPRGIEVRGEAEALDDDGGLLRIRPRRVLPWGIESSAFAPPPARDVTS